MFIEKMYLRQNITDLFRSTGSVFLVLLLCSFITHISEGVIFSAVCLYFSVAAYFAFRYDPFYFYSKRPALCFSQSMSVIRLSFLSYLIYAAVISGAAGFCLWHTIVFFYGSVSPAALTDLIFLSVISGVFLSSLLIISVNNKCCRRLNDD